MFNLRDTNKASKTKFLDGGFGFVQPVFLVHGLSIGNKKQEDPLYRAEFLKLVFNHTKRIIKCVEIIGDKIHAFYVGEEEAKKAVDKFKESNISAVKLLSSSNSTFFKPISITPPPLLLWELLSNSPKYGEFLKQVQDDYNGLDEEFKSIVDELAKEHKHKKDFDTAVKYILHECAGFLALPFVIRKNYDLNKDTKIVCTYPSKAFNNAIVYQLKKRNSELEYKGYNPKLPKNITFVSQQNNNINAPTQVQLMEKSFDFHSTLTKFGICEKEKQIKFFSEFLGLTEKFVPNLRQNNYGEIEDGEEISKNGHRKEVSSPV